MIVFPFNPTTPSSCFSASFSLRFVVVSFHSLILLPPFMNVLCLDPSYYGHLSNSMYAKVLDSLRMKVR